jgi:hypothetical protein
MANTIRTKNEILALFADNTTNNISPQDARDMIVSIYNAIETTNLLGPYLYIAFAFNANGLGFNVNPDPTKDYIAFKQSATEIITLQQSDFAGLWVKYKNNGPIIGQNVYIAYADDALGTGFTTTFSPLKDYIAVKASPTPLTPVVGDFAGMWKNWSGNSEFGLLTFKNSRNSNATNQFLRIEDGTASNLSPLIMPWDGTLKAISMSCETNSTWTAEVYVNGTLLPGATLTLTAGTKNYNNLYAIDVDANDAISLRCNGVLIPRPNITTIFKRRN